MRAEVRAQYDASRNLSDKGFRAACYAPFTSLYFETGGTVRVCCHNFKYPVGNIAYESIEAIWNGEEIRKLRQSLKQYDLRRGCQFCEWRLSTGNFNSVSMTAWDRFPVKDDAPAWPQMMEFSVSNSCNLQCIMCTGIASSAIRSHREKLPPLPRAYRNGFFEELRKFLPHLKRAKFLGGEPFLQRECFRVWEMMIEDGLRIPCHITTNGTQRNARVERVLDKLPVDISISMDGFSKQTVESIRLGASYDAIIENFHVYRSYARSNNTFVSLTFCLMRQNWHELGEFCLFADAWGCPVFVNSVRTPTEHSLYTLSRSELTEVVEEMEREASTLLPRLRGNLGVWVDEFERLRTFLESRQARKACSAHVPW
jgi:radical SAM protein with 4Fe4S-binding SPASM domain